MMILVEIGLKEAEKLHIKNWAISRWPPRSPFTVCLSVYFKNCNFLSFRFKKMD